MGERERAEFPVVKLQTSVCDSELLLSLIHVRSAVTSSFHLLMYNNVNSAGPVSSSSLNWFLKRSGVITDTLTGAMWWKHLVHSQENNEKLESEKFDLENDSN